MIFFFVFITSAWCCNAKVTRILSWSLMGIKSPLFLFIIAEVVDRDGLDVFGQGPLKKQVECICPSCQRNMAANRFAPHLEKCLGMGRNSSRLASRRLYEWIIQLSYLNLVFEHCIQLKLVQLVQNYCLF